MDKDNDKNKPTAKAPSPKEKDSAYKAPVFILNPDVDKSVLRRQAHLNLIAIRSMLDILDILDNESMYRVDQNSLIYFSSHIERLAIEVQELLIKAQ